MQKSNSFNGKISPWTPELDDRLCELVETDQYNFGQIAELMGLSRNQVTSRFTKLRQLMGPQGV